VFIAAVKIPVDIASEAIPISKPDRRPNPCPHCGRGSPVPVDVSSNNSSQCSSKDDGRNFDTDGSLDVHVGSAEPTDTDLSPSAAEDYYDDVSSVDSSFYYDDEPGEISASKSSDIKVLDISGRGIESRKSN